MKKEIKFVGGMDCSYKEDYIYGVSVVLSYPELKLIDLGIHKKKVNIPYIPGFLSFREAPALVLSYRKLKQKPDIILIDGQGILHPEGLGLASHIGIILKIPTIGCAKSHLIGRYKNPGIEKGDREPVTVDGEIKGYILRTKRGTKPLFISPGNLIDLEQSYIWILKTTKSYRLPEPLRYAHHISRKLRREEPLSISSISLP